MRMKMRSPSSKRFGLELASEETSSWHTVGDLEDAIVVKFAGRRSDGIKCPTSMTFYRLRGALKEAGCELRIAPSTRLSTVRRGSFKALCRMLHAKTGLQQPPSASLMMFGGSALAFASICTLVVCLVDASAAALPFALAGLVLGVWMFLSDPGWHPADFTVGDLARMVAQRNAKRLATEGARLDANFIKGAVRSLLAEVANHDERAAGRATRLI